MLHEKSTKTRQWESCFWRGFADMQGKWRGKNMRYFINTIFLSWTSLDSLHISRISFFHSRDICIIAQISKRIKLFLGLLNQISFNSTYSYHLLISSIAYILHPILKLLSNCKPKRWKACLRSWLVKSQNAQLTQVKEPACFRHLLPL